MTGTPDFLIEAPVQSSQAMEPVAELLRTLRVTGGLFLDAEFSAPWCVTSTIGPDDCGQFVPAPQSVVVFHYVSAGRLLLGIDDHPPVIVEHGEIVVLPHDSFHVLGSELNEKPIDGSSLIQPSKGGGLEHINYGGGGETTTVVCGFLGTDRKNDPVLNLLPRILKLKVEDGALGEWIAGSFQIAAEQTRSKTPQTTDMLTRLAELLFVETVGRYLTTQPSQTNSWCAAIRDPMITKALRLLHDRLTHHWTSEALAKEIGLSRSAFADRFTRLVGESPMRYLMRERLRTASLRLRQSNEAVARIAYDVGYESEAAFNRAFKREFGAPPVAWRKLRG